MPYDQTSTDPINLARTVVADSLGLSPDRVKATDSLATLGMDSLDRFDLIMRLEDALGTEIHDEEIDDVVTVADLAEYVRGGA